MRSTIISKFLFVVCIILALSGCNSVSSSDPSQSIAKNPFVTKVESSWPALYDLPSLVQGADLIVEGQIAGIHGVERVGYGIYTDYDLKIVKVLKSEPNFTQDSIVFRSQGGSLDNETQVVEDNEPYAIGERVFLFLRDISDDVAHTPQGQTKYSVLLLGGRFQINADDSIDSPVKDIPITALYRGKSKSLLEKDVLAAMPVPIEYMKTEAHAFLIVEGRVSQVEARQITDDDTQNIYTFYSFIVDQVLQDQLVRAQNAKRKASRVYDGTPVQVGDVITIIERGGTYQGITEQHTWSQFLQSDARMVLFLGAMSCGDLSSRGIPSPLCTQDDHVANKILYVLDGATGFVVGPDNRIKAVTPGYFSSFYDGAPKKKLFRDVQEAKQALEKEFDAQPEEKLPSKTK